MENYDILKEKAYEEFVSSQDLSGLTSPDISRRFQIWALNKELEGLHVQKGVHGLTNYMLKNGYRIIQTTNIEQLSKFSLKYNKKSKNEKLKLYVFVKEEQTHENEQ